MSGKNIKFGDEKINKRRFYKKNKLFKTEYIDINKILVSEKEPYDEKSFKYLIRYNDDDVRSLRIRLPQMVGYVNILEIMKKIVRECLLRLVIKNS